MVPLLQNYWMIPYTPKGSLVAYSRVIVAHQCLLLGCFLARAWLCTWP